MNDVKEVIPAFSSFLVQRNLTFCKTDCQVMPYSLYQVREIRCNESRLLLMRADGNQLAGVQNFKMCVNEIIFARSP